MRMSSKTQERTDRTSETGTETKTAETEEEKGTRTITPNQEPL